MKHFHLIGLSSISMKMLTMQVATNNNYMKSGLSNFSPTNHAIKESGSKAPILFKEEELESGRMAQGMMGIGKWATHMAMEE